MTARDRLTRACVARGQGGRLRGGTASTHRDQMSRAPCSRDCTAVTVDDDRPCPEIWLNALFTIREGHGWFLDSMGSRQINKKMAAERGDAAGATDCSLKVVPRSAPVSASAI
jgi:hypothetical protein